MTLDPYYAFWRTSSVLVSAAVELLPELVGKHFASPPKNMLEYVMEIDAQDEQKLCYCQEVDSGKMIICDNTKCPISWFHLNA